MLSASKVINLTFMHAYMSCMVSINIEICLSVYYLQHKAMIITNTKNTFSTSKKAAKYTLLMFILLLQECFCSCQMHDIDRERCISSGFFLQLHVLALQGSVLLQPHFTSLTNAGGAIAVPSGVTRGRSMSKPLGVYQPYSVGGNTGGSRLRLPFMIAAAR